MQKIQLLLFSAALTLTLFVGCRREVDEQPVFPEADFFTPSRIAEGDTVSIIGTGLSGSKVSFGGSEQALVAETENLLQFVVPSGAETGQITVLYSDEENDSFTFLGPLRVAPNSGVKEMLIGDFDGGGIRSAEATTDFLNGQWSVNTAGATSSGIASSSGGISASPAGGNFVYLAIEGPGILPNTFGFVGTFSNRAEIQDDGQNAWPTHFGEYPNAPFDMTGSPSDYYLNFYINHNGLTHGQVRIYLVDPTAPQGERYAYTIGYGDNDTIPEWEWMSIPLSSFSDNFGFGSPINEAGMQAFNKFDFTITDDFENTYDEACCFGNDNAEDFTCCDGKITEPVQIYLDHIVLSYGGRVTAPSN